MILSFGNIIADCYEDKKSLMAIIDEAERFVFNLSVNKTRSEFVSLKEALTPAIVKIGELYQMNNNYDRRCDAF
jgi:replicative DNA helicase